MKRQFLLAFICFYSMAAFSQRGDSLRVITYNIHHANPPSKPGVIDLDAVVSSLQKYPADIIALQEVDVNTKRSGNINEAKMIADGLGMQFAFAKAIDYDGGEYGIALLSRFPLNDINIVPLPMDSAVRGEKRVLLYATIRLNGRKVVVANTHLDHQRDSRSRLLQMDEIKKVAEKTALPFIIAGDFNTEPGSVVLQSFDQRFERTCEPCSLTFPADIPNRTIDFIGFKKSNKLKVLSHAVLPETYASDHRPVRAVILLQ